MPRKKRKRKSEPVEITAETMALLASRMDFPTPTLDHFKPAGIVRATAAGIAYCQTPEFAKELFQMRESAEAKGDGPEKIQEMVLVYAGLRVCTNDTGTVTVNDDDFVQFLRLNDKYIARFAWSRTRRIFQPWF